MSSGDILVRPPAVAGTFYPGDADALRGELRRSFAGAAAGAARHDVPKAIVVPHAGYIYSGPVAATACRQLTAGRGLIGRVVLLGPSHRVPVEGLGVTSADAWETPLGLVPIDVAARAAVVELPAVRVNDTAHANEHSLEVELPFLQEVLGDFELLPLVVGNASDAEVAGVLDVVWGGPETLIVISTDLSHYHAYDDAVWRDARTAAAITSMQPTEIADLDACGARPLRGLLRALSARGLTIDQLDLRNSGDTAGDKERVVGYGAFAVA